MFHVLIRLREYCVTIATRPIGRMRSHTVFGFERPLESRAKSSFGCRLGKESRPGRAAQEKGVILPLLPCGDEMFLLSGGKLPENSREKRERRSEESQSGQ